MLFTLSHAIMLSMAAVSTAQPSLWARAISDYKCGDTTITAAQITASIAQSRVIAARPDGPNGERPAYPKPFGNNCVGGKCFNVADALTEFPITTPVWDSKYFFFLQNVTHKYLMVYRCSTWPVPRHHARSRLCRRYRQGGW